MSSGSYVASPVLPVKIPKADGGVRQLVIPTIGDRIAQAVVKRYLEPLVEPAIHEGSWVSSWLLGTGCGGESAPTVLT